MATSKGSILEGKVRLVRRIATGGMGAVWEGEELEGGRRVAVKLLRSDRLGDPVVTERFRREARIARSVSHPNVCEVLDTGISSDGEHYIVMPLLEGRSLSSIIREGPLPLPRALAVTSQILAALTAAHRAGVVHRDLKPSNVILVEQEGTSDFVKVLDFGVSKLLRGDDEAPATITSTGAVLGTPQYMAPEQIRGGAVDHRIDLYSCGVILYELLTGARPYSGDVVQVLFQIVSGAFSPPRERRPDLPPEIESFVLRAMSRSAADRFASAEEMLAEVRRLADGEQTEPSLRPPPPPSYRPLPSGELATAPLRLADHPTEPRAAVPTIATPPAISISARRAPQRRRVRGRVMAVLLGLAGLGALAFVVAPPLLEGPEGAESPPPQRSASPAAFAPALRYSPAPEQRPVPAPPPLAAVSTLAPVAASPAVVPPDGGPPAAPDLADAGAPPGGAARARTTRPPRGPRKRLRIFMENE